MRGTVTLFVLLITYSRTRSDGPRSADSPPPVLLTRWWSRISKEMIMNGDQQSKMDLTEIQRDLRKKLDKAKPVVALVEKGELKVLSEAEERLVSMYPKWLAALEEAKSGRVPVLYGGQPVKSPDASPSPGAKTKSNAVAEVEPNGHSSSGSPAAAVSESSVAVDLQVVFRRIADDVKLQPTPKARKVLLEQHVNALVSNKQLLAAIKEFEQASELRNDIRSGRIAQPSKAQRNKMQAYDQLKRDVQHWRDFVKEQQELIRNGVAAALREAEGEGEAGCGAEGRSASRECVDLDKGEGLGGALTPARSADLEGDTQPTGRGDNDDVLKERTQAASDAKPTSASHRGVPDDGTVTSPDDGARNPEARDRADEHRSPLQEEAKKEDEEEEEEDEEAPSTSGNVVDDDDDDNLFSGFGDVFSVAKQKKRTKKEMCASAAAAPVPAKDVSPREVHVDVAPAEAAAGADGAGPPAAAAAAGPVEIDWSQLRYKKFRPRVVVHAQPASSGNPKTTLLAAANAPATKDAASENPGSGTQRPSSSSPAATSSEFLRLEIGARAPDAGVAARWMASSSDKKSSPVGAANNSPASGVNAGRNGTSNRPVPAASKEASVGSPASVSPTTRAVSAMVVARVSKELEFAQRHRIPGVAVCPLLGAGAAGAGEGTHGMTWCIHVSPLDGPLSGVLVPLRMHFTDFYPFTAPVVTTLVDIPHPNIVTVGSHRNALCMEHTGLDTWDPSSGAYSVLMQLQTYFSDENFEKAKQSVAGYKNKIRFARRDCSRFTATDSTASTPLCPVPEAALWNGPFDSLAQKPRAGLLRGTGTYRWMHCYARDGNHPFAVYPQFLLSGSTAASSDGGTAAAAATRSTTRRGDMIVELHLTCGAAGEAHQSSAIFFDVGLGIVSSNIPSECSASETPLAVADTSKAHGLGHAMIRLDVDLDHKLYRGAIVVSSPLSTIPLFEVPLPADTTSATPALTLGGKGATAAIAFSLSSTLDEMVLQGETAGEGGEVPRRCFLSLASADEEVLGVHVEVLSRNSATSLPTALRCSADEYISVPSLEAIRQRRVALFGRKIDGMIPLALSSRSNCGAATLDAALFREVKKQVMKMSRNPSASTLYDPPFRPAIAILVFSLALSDAVSRLAKAVFRSRSRDSTTAAHFSQEPAVLSAVRLFTHLLLTFAELVLHTPSVGTECEQQILAAAPCSAGHVFIASHFVSAPWPELVRSAFHTETAAVGAAAATDEQQQRGAALTDGTNTFNSLSRSRRTSFLTWVALTKSTRTSSVQRLVEALRAFRDGATAAILTECCDHLITASAVNSADALEDFVGAALIG